MIVKPVAHVLDVEVFPNYLLIGFKNVETGKVESVEAFGKSGRLSEDCRSWLRDFMKSNRTVGFNSINFDLPIIYAAIHGHPIKVLVDITQDIIFGNQRPWTIESDYGFHIPRKIDHIDLIEVAPGQASLKIYNGRLHGKRMQDLPYDPEKSLSDDEIEIVYRYWKNDLDATILLFTSLREQIDLREAMSVEYKQDLRSKSDAQIAEGVIKSQVADIMGDVPKRPPVRQGVGYKYNIPDFINFHHPALNDILDDIEEARFFVDISGKILMPKVLQDAEIKIGGGVYRMGIGGLHSSEKCQAVVADDDHVLIDRDVTSYYPFIIINQGLHPKHLGWAFLKVYKSIVKRRLQAKSDGNKVVADSLKITINGSFGKFGNRWSALYSPDLLIQTTITGQLALLMLIDRLERASIPVVSANTDGIVIRCPKRLIPRMDKVVKEWEEDTSFDTEATEYSALYSRDVNNYIAVKKGGGAKTKGAYASAGLMKNPVNEICVDAVVEHITTGKSLSSIIRGCRDIRKFVSVRTVKGGAVWGAKEVEVPRFGKTGKPLKPGVSFDLSEAEYLGKAIRWYYSTEVTGSIHYKSNGNRVPRSEGARPLMEMPDEFPDDVNYGWYVRECHSMLKDIGFSEDLV